MSESIQIYLNSATADKYINNNNADCEFVLPIIEVADGFHIYLSLHSALIPYSFYNINSSNNKLDYIINNITYNLIIVEGNYNVKQLASYLITNMTDINITYDNITNKFTFTGISDFTFLNSSSCFPIIGLINGVEYNSDSHVLKSVNCVNVNQIKSINVLTNLTTYNINKSFLNNSSIIASIPVNKPPYSVIEYKNHNNYRCNLFVDNLSIIKIKLVDEYENILNLNGCHFTMTIQLDVESFRD